MADEPRRQNYVHNIPAARRLRKEQTPSEEVLWGMLRGQRLLGLKFRRQHAVHAYVIDFFCDDLGLAIEVDGGVHLDPVQRARDKERQEILEEQGITFIRIDADALMNDPDGVLSKLADAISPLPQRRERGRG